MLPLDQVLIYLLKDVKTNRQKKIYRPNIKALFFIFNDKNLKVYF